VPFNSSGTNHEFYFNLNPGPGSYEYIGTDGNHNYAMRSKQERFGFIRKPQGPGPGDYNVGGLKAEGKGKIQKNSIVIADSSQLNNPKKNPPSIPSKNQIFG